MRHLSTVVLLGLAVAGCVDRGPFVCEIDADCVSASAAGVCEPEGLCSFPDESCDSGKRFGELSGDEAGQCVDFVPPCEGPDCEPAGAPTQGDGVGLDCAECFSTECQCIESVAAGSEHTCALKTDGSVWCWGNNQDGALGDGTIDARSTPLVVNGLPAIQQVAAGEFHTCALDTGGDVWCWGHNEYGSVGDGTTTRRTSPVELTGLPAIRAIDAGEFHTCALDVEDNVWCWGRNQRGQLGDGTTVDRGTPAVVTMAPVDSIAIEGHHACATTADGVLCWGKNLFGQLGDGTTVDRHLPTLSDMLAPAAGLGLGGEHTCFYRADGSSWCFGRGDSGQLGDGAREDRAEPVQVQTLDDSVQIVAGEWHTCSLQSNGKVYCWGLNLNGVVGDGTTSDRSAPVGPVKALPPADIIASGERHTCALSMDKRVMCWGYNGFGQLGDGTTSDRSRAVRADIPCP